MNNIKKAFLMISFFITMICFSGFQSKVEANFQREQDKKLYTNKAYNISLEYNKDWKQNPKYIEKYEGKNGFFQISAYTGSTLKIDDLVQSQVKHMLMPYGSNPKIISLKIQGQEARLILPSNDQAKELNNQAELIVKYPKEIKLDGDTYYYFVLWADKYNIQELAKTLKFIEP